MVAKEEIQVTLPQSWSYMDPERMDDTNLTSRDRIMVPKDVRASGLPRAADTGLPIRQSDSGRPLVGSP